MVEEGGGVTVEAAAASAEVAAGGAAAASAGGAIVTPAGATAAGTAARLSATDATVAGGGMSPRRRGGCRGARGGGGVGGIGGARVTGPRASAWHRRWGLAMSRMADFAEPPPLRLPAAGRRRRGGGSGTGGRLNRPLTGGRRPPAVRRPPRTPTAEGVAPTGGADGAAAPTTPPFPPCPTPRPPSTRCPTPPAATTPGRRPRVRWSPTMVRTPPPPPPPPVAAHAVDGDVIFATACGDRLPPWLQARLLQLGWPARKVGQRRSLDKLPPPPAAARRPPPHRPSPLTALRAPPTALSSVAPSKAGGSSGRAAVAGNGGGRRARRSCRRLPLRSRAVPAAAPMSCSAPLQPRAAAPSPTRSRRRSRGCRPWAPPEPPRAGALAFDAAAVAKPQLTAHIAGRHVHARSWHQSVALTWGVTRAAAAFSSGCATSRRGRPRCSGRRRLHHCHAGVRVGVGVGVGRLHRVRHVGAAAAVAGAAAGGAPPLSSIPTAPVHGPCRAD
ncbi:hypothetical protein BU14_1141s0001 [Porphyra umbilicalis]|uniref:Uncharacterized protein n=1 Tax=Porphyra umbilicalis TaxID=2786 RepID=A0A1X6NMI4_PORUM|nr:hypothetical protein BU14_1141s0001 [Porphyra umbilicalis]|eukprot:OSX69798.1 hypothetical protein BU14_1141s0001 [Porphyra umbilicalis]